MKELSNFTTEATAIQQQDIAELHKGKKKKLFQTESSLSMCFFSSIKWEFSSQCSGKAPLNTYEGICQAKLQIFQNLNSTVLDMGHTSFGCPHC